MTDVLIVDNNLIDIEALKEALDDAGFGSSIDVAMDAPEAIARLAPEARSRPDLVLLDLRLSIGHGLEVLQHLRAIPDLRHTPVVVMSNVLDDTDRAACLAAGATAVAVKPRRFAEQVALAHEWRALLGTASGSGGRA